MAAGTKASSSWPPYEVSSGSEALPAQTPNWSQSRHQRRRWCCLWDWCRGCCLKRNSWPAAEHLTLPSPVHELKGKIKNMEMDVGKAGKVYKVTDMGAITWPL